MLSIVIVDDCHQDALLAERVFAHCKVQNPVVLLNSGQACLDYFRGKEPYTDRQLPCLLLLDLVMAPISGLDVLEAMQTIPEANGSVVVMLSGLSEWRIIHAGYQLGAHTFLVKPLLMQDIMQMLNSVPALAIHKAIQGYEISISHAATGSAPEIVKDTTDTTITLEA